MYKIKEVSVSDFNHGIVEDVQPGNVSVLVELEFNGDDYFLDFQTSNTSDLGAISSNLTSYDGNSDHEKLQDILGDKFEDFLHEVKKESNVNKVWSDYINEHYVRDDSHFGGMDGNSERNEMKRK